MQDLQQPQTTSYGSPGKVGRYPLGKLPPAEHVSYSPELVGCQYGWVKIISPEKRWSKSWNHCYVLTECTSCGRQQWTLLDNLRLGRSKGCQRCSKPRTVPKWLERRMTAAKQRCTNPNCPEYPDYGARGIRFRFSSPTDGALWLMANLGLPEDRMLEIDRIDTNGDYAPGNLRYVDRKANLANRRNTVLTEYDPQYWPYERSVVTRKLSAGLSREEIIEEARTAVREKRKGWRNIAARLESMTYEMPDRIIVTPYRDGSSTTAATVAESAR